MMTTMTDDDATEVRRAKRSWPAQSKLAAPNEIEAAKESGATRQCMRSVAVRACTPS